jgi:hypothetical protein
LQKDKRLLVLRIKDKRLLAKDKRLLALRKIRQLLEKLIQAPEQNNTSA